MTKFCISCGTKIDNNAKFCPGCGTAAKAVPQQAEQPVMQSDATRFRQTPSYVAIASAITLNSIFPMSCTINPKHHIYAVDGYGRKIQWEPIAAKSAIFHC